MKKTPTHVVFSTKKVSKQQREARAAQALNNDSAAPTARVPLPHGEGGTSATTSHQSIPAPRQQLVVEVSDEEVIPAGTVERQSSAGSNSAPSSTGSSSSSHHRSQRSSKKPSRLGERSVRRLRPSPALLQNDQATVAQCVKKMVEKKTDAALLVDRNGQLTGILTDRDIAFKVVALSRNPRTTRVSDVMTPNPHCVASNESAIDALKKMVSGQFRHLPVTDNDKVVGILDIAKCLYEAIVKIEQDYNAHSKRLEEAIKKLQKHLPSNAQENLFEKLREKLFLPTLSEILAERSPVPALHPSSTALDAAILMLSSKTSAVMVCDEADQMVGIFTTKDLMRRVVALEVDPTECVLSSVMTPNPFSARLSTTILETLHSMHSGKFLHVPVFNDEEKLVGLVDVLQATCAIVQQMGTLQFSRGQPLWGELRESFVPTDEGTDGDAVEFQDRDDDDNEHDIEESNEERDQTESSQSEDPAQWGNTGGESVSENDPAIVDPTSPETDHVPDVFVFKLADWNGTIHRFTSSAESVRELLRDVQNRLGDHTIRKVHYIDDDGDHILLFTDTDLKDAVKRARMWGNKYLRLIVLHRAPHPRIRSVARAAHHTDNVLGVVYYAAAAAAIAGASFLLSRRR